MGQQYRLSRTGPVNDCAICQKEIRPALIFGAECSSVICLWLPRNHCQRDGISEAILTDSDPVGHQHHSREARQHSNVIARTIGGKSHVRPSWVLPCEGLSGPAEPPAREAYPPLAHSRL